MMNNVLGRRGIGGHPEKFLPQKVPWVTKEAERKIPSCGKAAAALIQCLQYAVRLQIASSPSH